MDYVIYAALAQETNEGWIWISEPELPTRTLVKVHNPQTKRTVFCVSRHIDLSFLRDYNDQQKHNTVKIQDPKTAIVISEWYRDALGGFPTTFRTPQTAAPPSLVITGQKWWSLIWPIRAACHHPESAVRIGTRLGVLGAWLGILGVALPILDLLDLPHCTELFTFLSVMIVTALIGIFVCRGTKGPVHISR